MSCGLKVFCWLTTSPLLHATIHVILIFSYTLKTDTLRNRSVNIFVFSKYGAISFVPCTVYKPFFTQFRKLSVLYSNEKRKKSHEIKLYEVVMIIIFIFLILFHRQLGIYSKTFFRILTNEVIKFAKLFVILMMAFTGTLFLAMKASKYPESGM